MKKNSFIFIVIILFTAQIGMGILLFNSQPDPAQDTVAVNECVQSIEENFGNTGSYNSRLPYVLLDMDGNILYKTGDGLSESINDAIKNHDTIMDIEVDGERTGRVIIYNATKGSLRDYRGRVLLLSVFFAFLSSCVLIFFYLYLKKSIITPFQKLNDFALRVAGGNLDLPLEVDRGHIFGSFTEAFDLMRSELKKSRLAEKRANDEKKEVIAKLSHDIKTPVASIKSTSELGYELAGDEKTRERFRLINEKSDQINALVTNLFHSSVNDVTEIEVHPLLQNSDILKTLILNSDYLRKAGDFAVPECGIFVDKLRLQQAFDNIFMNSYKYADTDIDVDITEKDEELWVRIADHGPGADPAELPLLTEKFKRGSGTQDKDGAGLGLYLADYFMKAMNGRLLLESEGGFAVTLVIRTI